MSKSEIIENETLFGLLTVKEYLGTKVVYGHSVNVYKCDCACGTKGIEILGYRLTGGGNKSCGCLLKNIENKKAFKKASISSLTTHGMSSINSTKEERLTCNSWRTMLGRCYSEGNASYYNYGAKGVKVCEYIKESPRNIEKLIGLRPCQELTLDRYPNKSGHYSCGQCDECLKNDWKFNIKWSTDKEQNNNKVSVIIYEYNGQKYNATDLAKFAKMSIKTLHNRLNAGMDVKTAVETPRNENKATRDKEPLIYTAFGITGTLQKLCKLNNMEYRIVRDRVVRQGIPIEQALLNENKKNKLYLGFGKWQTATEWFTEFGMNKGTFFSRLYNGMTIEQIGEKFVESKFYPNYVESELTETCTK